MIRLMGILVGSALATAALVIFVGIPQFTADRDIDEGTVITLPRQPTIPAEPVSDDRDGANRADSALPDAPPTSPDMPQGSVQLANDVSINNAIDATVDNTIDDGPLPPTTLQVDDQQSANDALPPVSHDDRQRQWHAFWSPFRSEIAATGFVSQLQRVTGLDYRVIKVERGIYEVAFAYSSDDEILNNLSQISAATGLDMPEG